MKVVKQILLILMMCNNLCAGKIGDINNDNKIGLVEAIYALQVMSGIKETKMYEVILTNRGIERITQKLGVSDTMKLSYISVGDGGSDLGNEITPSAEMTSLVREKWRVPITKKYIHPENAAQVMLEGHIPAEADGMDESYFITEVGVWDNGEDNGGVPELIAVGNHPKIQKTSPSEGHSNDIRLVVPILIGAVAQDLINLSIDPSVVYATKLDVDRVTPVIGTGWVRSNILLPEGNTRDYVVSITPIYSDTNTHPIADHASYAVKRYADKFRIEPNTIDDFFFSYIVYFLDSAFNVPSQYSKPTFTLAMNEITVSTSGSYSFQIATDISPGKYPWEQAKTTYFDTNLYITQDSCFVDVPVITPTGVLLFETSANAKSEILRIWLCAGESTQPGYQISEIKTITINVVGGE